MKKKLLFSGALAVAAMSAAAHASLVVSSSVTGHFGGFDEVTFHITGWSGLDADQIGGVPDGVTGMSGTFTAVEPNGQISVPGTAVTFKNGITNIVGGSGSTPPKSYANFESLAGPPTRNDSLGASTTSPTPTSLTADWFTGGTVSTDPTQPSPDTRLMPTDIDAGTPSDNGLDNTLLAQIYVTPGDHVSFTGTYNSLGGTNQPLSFSSAPAVSPEPASLALLGLAVGGLAIRRRRGL